jgi:hypothetical protein
LTLGEFGTYDIQVSFTNFLGLSGATATTVNTLTFESPTVEFDQSQSMTFYRYETIQLTAVFRHLKCPTGEVVEIFDALSVSWAENSDKRVPSESAPVIIPSQTVWKDTDGSTFSSTYSIAPYTADIRTTYNIQVNVQLTNKPVMASEVTNIYLLEAPL